MSDPSNGPNEGRWPGVVKTPGEVTVSSDHLLCCVGGDAVDAEFEFETVDLVFEVGVCVEQVVEESTRIGILFVPEKEVTLSFRLWTELDILSLRGR